MGSRTLNLLFIGLLAFGAYRFMGRTGAIAVLLFAMASILMDDTSDLDESE